MSYYRKHRPQVFSELDNESVRKILVSMLGKPSSELPHAFFLTGPRGTGKTTTARLLAKLFNCENPKTDGQPCGLCDMCQAIADGRAMDVMEIDAASNTGVDNIRELRQNIALTPSTGKRKIYIIDEVHMLSTGAFNALLKTLEEPPAHAVFILATTDPQKVPDTIQSRCLVLPFSKPDRNELNQAISRVIKKEKLDIDKAALELIITYSDGSFRDAVKLLEQASFLKGTITEAKVRDSLNLAEIGQKSKFIQALKDKNTKDALVIIQDLVKSGADMKIFTIQILSLLETELMVNAQDNKPSSDLLENRDMIRRLNQAYGEFKYSAIAQLPLELAVIDYCHQSSYSDTTVLPKISSVPTTANKSISPSSIIPKIKSQLETNNKKPIVEEPPAENLELITQEKLTSHWNDILLELKSYNHSVSAVLRSCKPESVSGNTVTIEAGYQFHKDKLSEIKTLEKISDTLKKLFGEKPRIVVTLAKK